VDLLAGDGWKTSPQFTDEQKAVIGWAEAVTNMTAHGDEAAFEAMKQHFNNRQIVELTLICSMWNLSNRFAESLHLVVEPPGHRIEFQPADLAGQDASSS
jgi:alkylhydroperoxidase family enzyme